MTVALRQSAGRAYSIDILRGLAILLMILSGLEPFGNLPGWMYHAQCPPPSHAFNPDVPGITWVDLVFPFFIFTMGAAVPFAMIRRLENGMSVCGAVFAIVKRYAFLLGFAIYAAHVNPLAISAEPTKWIWFLGIVMFFWMFMIWGRFPIKQNDKLNYLIKTCGVVLAGVVICSLSYKDGGAFRVFRTNIILFVLAVLAFFGSLIWLFTRGNILLRLGILGVVTALRLSYSQDGSWVQVVGNNYQLSFVFDFLKSHFGSDNLDGFRWVYDLSWLIRWSFLKYLYIIIPATIVGEKIYDYVSSERGTRGGWKKWKYVTVCASMVGLVFVALVSLFSRNSGVGLAVSAVISCFVFWVMSKPSSELETLLLSLFKWAAVLLLLGYLLEPFEGGIKKDPSTLSYYFITGGLAICVIIAVKILLRVFDGRKWFSLFIYSGQNPMIAYLTSSNVLIPLLAILGLRSKLLGFYGEHRWGGFVLACGLVLLVAVFVGVFSKKRIYLRT